MITLLKKEFTEIYRSKKFIILAGILLFMAVSSAIFAKLLPEILKNTQMPAGFVIQIPEPTWKDAIDQFIKNISQIVLIVVVLVFAGSIADEKSKKTLEIVLTKPISRTQLILAKFVSSSIVLIGSFVATSAIFYFYSSYLFEGMNLASFSYLALFTLIFMLLVLSITIFTSTISGSQIVAAGLSFFIEVILMAVLPYIHAINKYLPTYILSSYKSIFESGKVSEFLPSVCVSLVLIMVFVISSIMIFKNQEIER